MIPDQNGTAADFFANITQTISESFDIPSDFNFDNLELVVFVQDLESKEVLHRALAIRMSTAIKELNENIISKDPNPAKELLIIETHSKLEKLEICSHLGRLVRQMNTNSQIINLNFAALEPGVYFVELLSSNKVIN